MLLMARRAIRRECLIRVVNRAIMAGKARLIARPRAKRARRLHVARIASRHEHRVRGGEFAPAVDSLISCQATPRKPLYREHGRRHREPEAPPAKWVRALEIIQVDALGQLFCRALRARQSSSLSSTATPLSRERSPAAAARMTAECASSASHAANDECVTRAAIAALLRKSLRAFASSREVPLEAVCAIPRTHCGPYSHPKALGAACRRSSETPASRERRSSAVPLPHQPPLPIASLTTPPRRLCLDEFPLLFPHHRRADLLLRRVVRARDRFARKSFPPALAASSRAADSVV